MKLMRPSDTKLSENGFTLIEVVLALGVFFISILALIGLLSPMLKSVGEVEKIDEITSVVNTVNAFLQSSAEIAPPGESKFNEIYEAVASDGYATVFVFRQYVADDSDKIRLKIGFLNETDATIQNSDIRTGSAVKAAGNVYRVVLTPASVMPLLYYHDSETNTDGDLVPIRNDNGVYQLGSTYASNVEAYDEGYFAMEARIYSESPGPDYEVTTLPNGETANLGNLDEFEPDFVFNTAIVR